MKHFVVSLLVGFFALGPHSFGAVNARNGVAITTSSTLNGRTPNSAINGISISGGGTPAWIYNVTYAAASSDFTAEVTFTFGAIVTADQSGDCTKVGVGCTTVNFTGRTLAAGLYDMSLNLLGSGTLNPVTTGTDVDLEVTLSSPVAVTASTSYIVLYATSASDFGNFPYAGGANQGRIDFGAGYSTFPLNPSTAGTGNLQFRVGMYIEP